MREEKQATFHQIMEEWSAQQRMGYRPGQALFAAVMLCDGATGEAIRGSLQDPFYNDSLVPSAISWLAERYFG